MTIPIPHSILKLMYIFFVSAAVILLGIVFLAFTPRDRALFSSQEQSFDWEGQSRKFVLSQGSQPTPDSKLLLGLHGFGDSPRRFAYYTGLHNTVGESDIVLYPSATKPTEAKQKTGWNAAFCCGSGWFNKVDDVGFLSQLAISQAEAHGISPENIFVVGFSNGAFMAQRLSAERPDVFKAAAARSGSIGTKKQSLSIKQPVPIYLSHGEQDTTVPFTGGVGKSDPDFDWKSFSETIAAWKEANGTNAPTVVNTHPNEAHIWHDWRLINFWHKKPQGSKDIVTFFDSL
ncbi:MAG: dienelactone hydrolase family protein [bacterium]|nr:dienelactone hydrolase family protein [bacterium]